MTKIVFFIAAGFISFSVFASNTPNNTSNNESETYVELFEDEENAIPAYLDNHVENTDSDEREGANEDEEWLQYLCEGKTVFVKPEHRQWYDENCLLVLNK